MYILCDTLNSIITRYSMCNSYTYTYIYKCIYKLIHILNLNNKVLKNIFELNFYIDIFISIS